WNPCPDLSTASMKCPDHRIGAMPFGFGGPGKDQDARDQASECRDQHDKPPGIRIGHSLGRVFARWRHLEMEPSAQNAGVHETERQKETNRPQSRDQADERAAQGDSADPRRRPHSSQPVEQVADSGNALSLARRRLWLRLRHGWSALDVVKVALWAEGVRAA